MFDFCRFSSYNFDIIGSLVAVLVGSLSVALFSTFSQMSGGMSFQALSNLNTSSQIPIKEWFSGFSRKFNEPVTF